jgi:maltose/moltooligosaccharide transporter
MPFSPALWAAALLLWVMDASINITMEPFRAFVGDLLPDEQRTAGFAMQSVFIGAGAVLASVLPWVFAHLGVPDTAAPGHIPPTVVTAFLIGAAGYLGAVLWTIVTTREYSPQEMAAFAREEAKDSPAESPADGEARRTRYIPLGLLWVVAGAGLTASVWQLRLPKETYVVTVGAGAFGLALLLAALLKAAKATKNGFSEVMEDLLHMPRTMSQLAVVQFFTWFGLYALWVYTTTGVTERLYHTTDTHSAAYNQGADWVGVLFGVYNGVAAVAAFLLPRLAALVGRRTSHAISLALGGVGLASFLAIKDPNWLLAPMVGIGVAWASILSAPYAILSGALPAQKMGVYMGIFNIFIVVPQILAGTLLGGLLKAYAGAGHAMFALAAGGISMLIAAIATLFVSDPHDPKLLSVKAPTR